MKKTKFYRIFHESYADQVLLRPCFGITYKTSEGKDANVVFGFPTTHDPVEETLYPVKKAIALYNETMTPVDCVLFYKDETNNYLFSLLDTSVNKKIFGIDKIRIFLLNLAVIASEVRDCIKDHTALSNAMLFMYAYHCGIDEVLISMATNEQLIFLDDDWQLLLSDTDLQKKFASFFMTDWPL